MKIIFIFLILKYIIIANSAYAKNPIEVKTVYPPKCTLLKEKNGLLCPRIIEVEVKITSDIKKHLVRCTLFSEEEEILAFGELRVLWLQGEQQFYQYTVSMLCMAYMVYMMYKLYTMYTPYAL